MAYQTVNPTTGETLQTYPDITNDALAMALEAAQHCYATDWRQRSPAARAVIVHAAASRLRANADEYARYISLEMGKRIAEARGEVALSADILDYYASRGPAFLEPRAVPGAPNSTLEMRPLGVILAVEPWNFPYYQLARVAGPQLMVGNVVLAKHAANVPQCARAFARLFEEAGAPVGAYTNLFADFQQIAWLIEDPRVRGVTLTGSERAGAAVAAHAGRHLKKSVLELGGSDPFIVLPDAPMEATLDNALWGRMNNNGQCCVAAKRFIVLGKERGFVFLAGLVARMGALRAGDPLDAATTLAPVSSASALTGLLTQVALARAGGASVVLGGHRIDRPGFFLEPTVLADVDAKNPIYAQEIFGPVAVVHIVDTEAEAVLVANATPFGLGGSVYSADLDHARRIAAQIESGMVSINRPTWTSPELPFGGIKNSGYGRELSELGFGEFVNRHLTTVSPPGASPPS